MSFASISWRAARLARYAVAQRVQNSPFGPHDGLTLMTFRIVNALMALIFLMAVVVQYNDPDPLPWMAIYGAACVISVLAWRRRVHPAAPVLVGAVALVWSLGIMLGGPTGTNYLHMFDAWEMQSVNVEQAREATGLLIVAAWMAVLAFRRTPRA